MEQRAGLVPSYTISQLIRPFTIRRVDLSTQSSKCCDLGACKSGIVTHIMRRQVYHLSSGEGET
jgi:hypothetical protein